MLDIRMIRENPDLVKENIKKKFQEDKLPLVDEVLELDVANRAAKTEGDELRAKRNALSKSIGGLMKDGKKDEAEKVKGEVKAINDRIEELELEEGKKSERIREIMLVIPQIIDDTVPIGKDDTENVELERFGEPVVPDYEVPYHVDIMESVSGIDLDSSRKTSGRVSLLSFSWWLHW